MAFALLIFCLSENQVGRGKAPPVPNSAPCVAQEVIHVLSMPLLAVVSACFQDLRTSDPLDGKER